MQQLTKKLIIFTDMDGTLLDHDTYSYSKAKPALNLIKKHNIPLILCTSKNRAEILEFQKELRIKEPFIVENGGAIFIPKDYFNFELFNALPKTLKPVKKSGYYVIELGTPYKTLRNFILELKKQGFKIKGFGDMSAKEVSLDTGLPLHKAKLAKKREYDEAFIFTPVESYDEKKLKKLVLKQGLRLTKGGRYYHLMGKSNKGKAVKILTKLYKKQFNHVITMALGDSVNDFEMLDNVDIPYLVMKKNRRYSSSLYKRAGDIGPKGWCKAVKHEVSRLKI